MEWRERKGQTVRRREVRRPGLTHVDVEYGCVGWQGGSPRGDYGFEGRSDRRYDTRAVRGRGVERSTQELLVLNHFLRLGFRVPGLTLC